MHFVLAAGRRAGGTSAHPSVHPTPSERRSARRLCPMIALFAFEGLSSPSDSDGGGDNPFRPLARSPLKLLFNCIFSLASYALPALIHLQPREGTFPSILISYDAPSFEVKNDREPGREREADHNTRNSFTELLPSFT